MRWVEAASGAGGDASGCNTLRGCCRCVVDTGVRAPPVNKMDGLRPSLPRSAIWCGSRWVIHTVGPIVYGDRPTETDRRLLADCYRNCMALADEKGLKSIAFCCISTGEFHYPQEEAARVAVDTVEEYLKEHPESGMEAVVFDVFKESDYEI